MDQGSARRALLRRAPRASRLDEMPAEQWRVRRCAAGLRAPHLRKQPSESVRHASERREIANSGPAIRRDPALDTAAAQLIAVLGGTIRFFATADASATVTRAEMAEAGGRALAIFVALIANLPSLIAPVSAGGARFVLCATLHATVGQEIARETR